MNDPEFNTYQETLITNLTLMSSMDREEAIAYFDKYTNWRLWSYPPTATRVEEIEADE